MFLKKITAHKVFTDTVLKHCLTITQVPPLNKIYSSVRTPSKKFWDLCKTVEKIADILAKLPMEQRKSKFFNGTSENVRKFDKTIKRLSMYLRFLRQVKKTENE